MKRFLRRFLKVAGRGLAFLALLIVAVGAAGFIAVKIVFTPERIKFLLLDQLETRLQRPVVMDSVSLDPLGGVRVDGFRVLRKDKPWEEPFIESETFIANFQLLPLLTERRIVLDEIWLARPRIQVIRYADGSFNFQDLFRSTAPTTAPAGPVALSIAEAQLTNGRVVYRDEASGGRHEFSQIQARIRDLAWDRPFRVNLSFTSEHQFKTLALPPATFDLNGRLDLGELDPARMQLDISELQVRTPSWRISARGYAADVRHPRGALDADVSPVAAGAELSIKNLKGLVLAPLSAQVSFAMPDYRTLNLKAFQVSDRRSRVEGDAAFTFSESSPTWRVRLKSPGVELADAGQYVRALAPYALSGQLSFETTISSGTGRLVFGRTRVHLDDGSFKFGEHVVHQADVTFAAPPDMKVARLQVADGAALYFGQNLSEVNFDAEIRGPDWTFHSVRGVWNRMRWKLRGKVTQFFSPKKLEIHGGADVIYIQEIVNLADRIIEYNRRRATEPPRERKWFEYVKYGVSKAFPALEGRLSARRVEYRYLTAKDFAIRFDVQGIESGMRNLTGTAEYAMGPGQILHTKDMMENSKFLRVLFLPFLTLDRISTMGMLKGFQEKDVLPYRKIVGDYKATWGNVRVNELVIDTEEILLSGNGQLDLNAESIQLYVLNRLYKSKGTLPETLTCDDGKPCVAFFVEGNLGLPDVRLDLNKIRTQKGADILNKRLEQIRSIIPLE